MKRELYKNLAILIFASALVFLSNSSANAQGMYSSSSGGWNTGFGTVYGSHGYALATQDMYRVMQRQANQNMIRDVTKSSSRTKNTGSSSGSKTVAPPARVVRNYGVFRPDATVDTGKALADSIGETPEEKAFLKKIFTATKTFYEKEAAAKGWKNNIAGSLTFFTATAMTVYHDGDEPSADAANNYFKAVNSALDEMPDLAKATNKEKQAFNNVLIGFSGILLTGYTEAKQTNNAETLDSSKKLAGMLIELILKTNPENITIKDNQIAVKL
jgi:hypothetical protein